VADALEEVLAGPMILPPQDEERCAASWQA
jgi:hypothetical protein